MERNGEDMKLFLTCWASCENVSSTAESPTRWLIFFCQFGLNVFTEHDRLVQIHGSWYQRCVAMSSSSWSSDTFHWHSEGKYAQLMLSSLCNLELQPYGVLSEHIMSQNPQTFLKCSCCFLSKPSRTSNKTNVLLLYFFLSHWLWGPWWSSWHHELLESMLTFRIKKMSWPFQESWTWVVTGSFSKMVN